MTRSKSRRKRGILSSMRHWFRRRPERSSSLKSKRNSTLNTIFSFPAKLSRRLRLLAKYFFRFSSSTTKVASAFNNAPTKRLKAIHFLNPLNWITWPVGFLFSYLLSRPYLSLGPALLAIAISVAAIALLVQQRYQGGKTERVQLYQQFLGKSLQAKDYKTALICCQTLVDLLPNDVRFQFERAKIEKELGHDELSQQLLLRLATKQRYGLAAIQLTESRFKIEKVKEWTKEEHQLFRGLISIAVSNPDRQVSDAAKLKLSSYLSTLEAYGEALRHIADLVPRNPQLSLTALELAVKTNDQVRIQTLIPIAKEYYTKLIDQEPNDHANRLRLARVLTIDRDIDSAIALINDGLRLQPSQELENALGEAIVLKADQIARGKQTPIALVERMQLIHRAAGIAPNNPLVVEAIIDLVLQVRNNEHAEVATLREAALQGLDPASLHFVRGTIALLDNNVEEAKIHLQLAAKSGLQLPGILNNLAVAIASDQNGNLDEALALANAAIEKLDHPYLFETRGQILFRQKKYAECILDLEKGLQSQELAPAIYPSLVVAYKEIGNPKLADEYATRLAQLKKPE